MKKALIITHSLYPDLGGTAKYTDLLINLLKNDYQIDIFIINFNIEKNKLSSYYNNVNFYFYDDFYKKVKPKFPFYIFTIRKSFKIFLKQHKYNLIIDQTNYNFKELRNKDNAIWVAHSDAKFFYRKIGRNLIEKTIYKIASIIDSFIKNNRNFKFYKNVVLFSKFNEIGFRKYSKRVNKNTFYIPNPSQVDNQIVYDPNGKIISYCRFDDSSKNLKLMNDISKKLKNKIIIYGEGKDKDLLSNCIVKNSIKSEDLYKIFSNASLFIMTSRFEGFPFSLVESISYGIPIVVIDSFSSAKFFINNEKNGLLINKNENSKKIAIEIEKLLNNKKLLKEMSQNCKNFWKENLTIDNFNEKWKDVITKIST